MKICWYFKQKQISYLDANKITRRVGRTASILTLRNKSQSPPRNGLPRELPPWPHQTVKEAGCCCAKSWARFYLLSHSPEIGSHQCDCWLKEHDALASVREIRKLLPGMSALGTKGYNVGNINSHKI